MFTPESNLVPPTSVSCFARICTPGSKKILGKLYISEASASKTSTFFPELLRRKHIDPPFRRTPRRRELHSADGRQYKLGIVRQPLSADGPLIASRTGCRSSGSEASWQNCRLAFPLAQKEAKLLELPDSDWVLVFAQPS